MRNLYFTSIISVLCVACVGTAPHPFLVLNRTRKPLSVIEYQVCNDAKGNWQPLKGSESLPSNAWFDFEYPASCINMRAYDQDGKMAGMQSKVLSNIPFKWTIKPSGN